MMNFKDFSEKINEERPTRVPWGKISDRVNRSLEKIGVLFKSDEAIVSAIEQLNFRRLKLASNASTAEYAFQDPDDKTKKFIVYDSGYVRSETTRQSRFSRGEPVTNQGALTSKKLETTRLRLLFIFRKALKRHGVYEDWIKYTLRNQPSDKPLSDFMRTGKMQAKKYGL